MTVCRGLDPVDVLRLRRGLERHCPVPFQLVCLNDIVDKDYEQDGVIWRPLAHKDWPAHFSKVEMWRPDLDYGQVVYLDLSCVITGDVSPLLAYDGPMCVVEDFYWGTPCQSVASFSPGRPYYAAMRRNPEFFIAMGSQNAAPDFHDQTLMNYVEGPVDYWPRGTVVSYKIDGPAPGACVVKFHGKPKPEDTDWAKAQHRSNIDLPVTPYIEEWPQAPEELVLRTVAWPQVPMGKTNPEVLVSFVGEDEVDWAAVGAEVARGSKLIAFDRGVRQCVNRSLIPDVGIFIAQSPEPCHEAWVSSGLEERGDYTFHCNLSAQTHRELRSAYLRSTGEGKQFKVVLCRGGPHASPLANALSLLPVVGYRKLSIHGVLLHGGRGVEVPMMGRTFSCSQAQYDSARQVIRILRSTMAAFRCNFSGDSLLGHWLATSHRLS